MSFVNFNNKSELNQVAYTKTMVYAALLEAETKNVSKAKKMIAGLAEEVTLNEALALFNNKLTAMSTLNSVAANYQPLLEGQFSWLTHDRGEQIGSERENTIDVWMFDNQGNMWYEKRYGGYGEFGNMDYYDLVAKMNGYSEEDLDQKVGKKRKIYREMREIGIALAFNELETRDKDGKVLFPALMSDPMGFNYKRHDFTQEAPSDPNQSWYQEPEYDDEDEYYESKTNEGAIDLNDPVLVAFRAAKQERAIWLNQARIDKKSKRKPLYGKERLKAEDDLWYISQDLKDLYADRGQMLIDMEQEAEVEGGPIANEYGDKLNKIEDEIQKLITKRNKLEMRLAESVINEGVMSEIDILAKEAKNFKEFVKAFKTDGRYKGLDDAGDTEEFEAWLQSVYDNAKMDESVVTEAKGSALQDYVEIMSQKTFKGGGNGQNLLDDAMGLAGHIDSYTLGRDTRGYEEDGFYEPATIALFKKLVDSMSADDIKNNQADKYESVVTEARSINKIQKEWSKVTSDMKETVDKWKAAEEGELKTSLLAKLKGLTAQKHELEAELNAAVQLKDVDAELVGEAWFGPFQFNDKMSDEELKKMYDEAIRGYAYWQKGFYPKSDFKKAYQEIAKILKKRGVVVESVETNEGNAFGAARAEAIAKGKKTFKVGDEEYDVDSVDKEDKENAKEFVEESVLCEATVEMDAMDPDNKDFLKFLKKHKVEIIDKKMDGPGGGQPVITMQGKRKDLETVLADEEFGWADPDLAEYIEESVKEAKLTKAEKWMQLAEKLNRQLNEDLRADLKKFIKANQKELNELADADNWDAIHDMLRTEFDVKEGSKQEDELFTTFNFVF